MTVPFEWLSGWDHEPLADRPLRVIGIDLGTTNSTITEIVWRPGSDDKPIAEVLDVEQETTQGSYVGDVVPSVVATYDGRVLVGEGAHRLRGAVAPHLDHNKELFWETKNEIGTRRTYLRAPADFTTPRDIATHILRFLNEAAQDAAPQPIDRVVVTVPASFQWEQRSDTLEAARAAGLDLQPGDLLDEPVAALLDYLATQGTTGVLGARSRSTVMVLDFGGGTCDVAVLGIAQDGSGGLEVARVGVSRFHRIGGSDIDMQIAHDVLLPALLSQHDKAPHQFDYVQKRDFILPALQSVAAQLKVLLSDEMRRRARLGTLDPNDRTLQVRLPAPVAVPARRRGEEIETLRLDNPTLTLPQLRKALEPFLETMVMLPRDTEYTHANSVFAPVGDVLTRCNLVPDDVDACLLVGGSSLFVPLREAVEQYLPSAAILSYQEPRDALRCVGRGAAFHALLLAAYGTSPLSPTTGDSVSIRTKQGLETLVPRNARLPFPDQDAWAEVDTLRMAAGNGQDPQRLSLEVVSGDTNYDARTLALQPVDVQPPVRKDDRISVRTRVDSNQRLALEAVVHTSAGEQTYTVNLDNPFSVTINPNASRERIMELEELVATRPPRDKLLSALKEMAGLHADLGEHDRAATLYNTLLPLLPQSQQAYTLNLLGILYGQMGNLEGQIKAYRRAAELGAGTAPLFNLALALRKQNKLNEALAVLDDEVLPRDDGLPARALRGLVLDDLSRRDEARVDYRKALDRLGDLERTSDFKLGWALIAAQKLGDEDLERRIREEQRRRERKGKVSPPKRGEPLDADDYLPAVAAE